MTVFVCPESFEGVLCGVYDAWMSRLGHANVRLELENHGNIELFCEYRQVFVDEEKVDKVTASIRSKISDKAYEMVYKAYLNKDELRADKIYRFLIYGFYLGRKAEDMLQIPAVFDLFELCRYVDNESHLLLEFVRFKSLGPGLLISRIGPKNDVVVLLAPHFADRLSCENWIIYDEKREKAVLHPANRPWFLMDGLPKDWRDGLEQDVGEDQYQQLWKIFRKSVTIAERRNPACQRNHLPLRYRPYMTEFEDCILDG